MPDWMIQVPVGHMKDPTGTGLDEKWSELVDKARSMVIATVRARTGIDLQPLIIDEDVNSPLTCEFITPRTIYTIPRVWFLSLIMSLSSCRLGKEKFNLDRGAILGLSHSFL